MDNSIDVEELRAKAVAVGAAFAKWQVDPVLYGPAFEEWRSARMAYEAASNPATILALVDELKTLRACRDALRELVACKDLAIAVNDALIVYDESSEEYKTLAADYERRKPAAWEAARAAIRASGEGE